MLRCAMLRLQSLLCYVVFVFVVFVCVGLCSFVSCCVFVLFFLNPTINLLLKNKLGNTDNKIGKGICFDNKNVDGLTAE